LGLLAKLDRLLDRTVRVRIVAALVLFLAFVMVAFGWYVQRSVYLRDESTAARAAVAVASFPSDVKEVFLELGRMLDDGIDYSSIRAAPPENQWSDFSPVASDVRVAIEGLIVMRGPGSPARGWRLIVGVFRIDGAIQHAALLLSPDLKIVHHWLLMEGATTDDSRDPHGSVLTHGFSVLADGSVIYAVDEGTSLIRKDPCGRIVWDLDHNYHHSVTLDDTATTVWTLRNDPGGGDEAERSKIVQIAVDDGTIVREFSVADIISANPTIDILELRRPHEDLPTENDKGSPGRWTADPFHLNDVDPLPTSLADRFPLFSAGDLLVSARELNLIFVVDPRTLAIKWWHVGATIRQHDPDWTADGRLAVYNNRMSRGYSEIVEIDPVTFDRTVAVDGHALDFYSRIRGKQQAMPGGGWLVTSPQQGRIMELSPRGDIALEFYVLLQEAEPFFPVIMEAIFLPESAIDIGVFPCGDS
jgi:hypothetical protein